MAEQSHLNTAHSYKLSVVMIIKNEAENLRISLQSIAELADEIILLDSGSTDNSKEIAEQFGAKWFVNTNWPGFGKQRQIAQSHATGDWILALDADEEVTPKLADSIRAIKNTKPANTVYGIKRLDFVFGHQIDNALWGVKAHWRLYPARFGYDDNLVHESVVLHPEGSEPAQTHKLSGFLHHHTAPTPHFWIDKRLDYAQAWAVDRFQQNKKVGFWKVILNPTWAFVKQYVIDGRFIQGRYGFIYSYLFAQYTFNKYGILYDMNRQPESYAADYRPHAITYDNLPTLPKKATGNTCTLSVVMIVKNEEKHLPACLHNIYYIADEIIILDSGSTDNTKAIAAHFGAKWYVNTDWQGFGKQRQLAQTYATGDYVLMMDADEHLDDTLKNSIQQVLQKPLATHSAFAVKRDNLFCERSVYGRGWYADKIARLYSRKDFYYNNLDVHESLDLHNKPMRALAGKMTHHTNVNLHHYLETWLVRYSHEWAENKYKSGKRQPSLFIIVLKSVFSFLREYVIRGGFLGGTYGFMLSVSLAHYTFNKYIMLSEKKSN